MRILSLVVFVLFSSFAHAKVDANTKIIATVVSLSGNIKVKRDGSFRKRTVKLDTHIKEGDLITSSAKSALVLELVDKSIVALGENASVHFCMNNQMNQANGKVYYKIVSRDAKNALAIKTPFAIMGIKGTTFIIDGSEDGSLTLKEGLIGVTSLKEEFKLYRKKIQEEFEAYTAKQNKEFESFKQENDGYTLSIVKEFDIKTGNIISFSSNSVKEDKLSKDDDKEFDYFENMIQAKK